MRDQSGEIRLRGIHGDLISQVNGVARHQNQTKETCRRFVDAFRDHSRGRWCFSFLTEQSCEPQEVQNGRLAMLAFAGAEAQRKRRADRSAEQNK